MWRVGKRGRRVFTPLMAEALMYPDEIWLGVAAKQNPVRDDVEELILDRRYIRADPAVGDDRGHGSHTQKLAGALDRLGNSYSWHKAVPFIGTLETRGARPTSRGDVRRLGIEALYRKPNTSGMHPGHAVYPYPLRGLKIDRPNQVWAMDITYIPMPRGFVYLAAVIDWSSRRMLAWRVSITMDIDFCIEAVEDAIARYGTPEIFNTDQDSRFTSQAFTGLLKEYGITISMDGKGCWRDNVFIERLWKSLKYEEVYLHAYDSAGHARGALLRYLDFYNRRRTAHLIGSRPIRSTSTNRCPVRRQLEPAGDPLIGTGLSVQTNGASSQHRDHGPPALPQRHGPPPA